MHYLITTVGPISQDFLTHALLTYMNYPSYIPAHHPAAGNGPLRSSLSLLPSSRPPVESAKPVFGPARPTNGRTLRPASLPVRWPSHPITSPLLPVPMALQRGAGTPMMAHTGNMVTVGPGIQLRQLGNVGHTYQDLFFWQQQVGGRTNLLSVSSRGAFHDWQELPLQWDNAHMVHIQPAQLGTFRQGQPPAKAIDQLTLAEKLAHAMWLSKAYLGEEAKALVDQLTSPEAIGQLITFEIVYTVSLFFGVGEVVTGLAVILGTIFVGEVVIDILKSLKEFVELAKAATTEQQLDAAARKFAHAMTLGLAIVGALLLRKAVTKLKPGNVPENVVRRGGMGQKKPTAALAEEAAVVKPLVSKVLKPKKLKAGTPEHKLQRWKDYQKKGGNYDYDKWSKQYDTNMRNTRVGLDREAEYQKAMGGASKTVKTSYTNRQVDVFIEGDEYMGQIKTGKVSLTEQAKIDIAKDAELVKRGFKVEYILEKGASKPFLEALNDAGVDYKIGPQIP